jgi:hypothetical protein
MSINMLIFLYFQTIDYTSAQHRGNMILKCSTAGNCTTEVCIDDQPCETIKSNSKNGTELGDFWGNKTKVTLIPQEVV